MWQQCCSSNGQALRCLVKAARVGSSHTVLCLVLNPMCEKHKLRQTF